MPPIIDRLRNSLSHLGVSLFALHGALVLGAALYTVGGALIIRTLESWNDETTTINRSRRTIERNAEWGNENISELSTTANMDSLATSLLERYSGSDLSELQPLVHDCVTRALETLFNTTNCNKEDIDRFIIADFDRCYQMAASSAFIEKDERDVESEEDNKWSLTDSLIFAFTVITTIGYGNVAPVTFEGRAFLIVYGLIGVPLTLLTIADLGMFISKMMKFATAIIVKKLMKVKGFIRMQFMKRKLEDEVNNNIEKPPQMNGMTANKSNDKRGSIEKSTVSDEDINREFLETIALGVTFFGYLFCGAYILSLYEPELDFFKAFYFNFITVTTVGLGDFVPKRETYLLVTIAYITLGLALTTLTFDIAAQYLRKVHYFGRKIENVANAVIWFGGKKMSLKSLVRHLGDHFNIPLDELNNLNLDTFVDAAIKVEAGEIKTLRKPEPEVVEPPHPVSYQDLRRSCESESLKYADEWTSISTSGSEVPLAEETARTVSSTISKVDQSSIKSEDAFRLDRQSAKLKERILRYAKAESEPPAPRRQSLTSRLKKNI
ncbi:TWiK family of potassium channels protein 9 [Toxocara canis]|uniref:TWiK family of potassium channels protein 9 n=1 Tax=Toxocara canis TaxID=6265 RepID=A0A0B2UVL7_TOXCA|nr:TWiK family of potassium channels protein 9 [Toxocara canis]